MPRLMGATTYRLMSGFAAQMPDDPGLAGLTALPKVVFSSHAGGTPVLGQLRAGAGDAVAAVRELKNK